MKSTNNIKRDTGWVEITNFNAGYQSFLSADYTPVSYRIIDDFCYFRGVILRNDSVIAKSNVAIQFVPEITPTTRCNFLIPEWTTPDTTIRTVSCVINAEGFFSIFAPGLLSVKRHFSVNNIFYPIA